MAAVTTRAARGAIATINAVAAGAVVGAEYPGCASTTGSAGAPDATDTAVPAGTAAAEYRPTTTASPAGTTVASSAGRSA